MIGRWLIGRTGLAWLVALALAGCAGAPQGSTDQGPSNKQLLVDVAEWLKAYAKDHKKAPTSPADIAAYEPTFPDAHQGITKKIIVYQWGVGLSSGGDAGSKVLAYEKDAETKGGWVLMQDGTIKQMTAAAFQAAPKAKK